MDLPRPDKMATFNRLVYNLTKVVPDRSAITTDEMREKLHDGTATYQNTSKSFGRHAMVVASSFAVTDTGEMLMFAPAGLPPDMLGSATNQFNQKKKKHQTKERLLAKLEAKKRAREE